MANDLTGDFDVVAEFTTDAANRVLAAMHRTERFPHSMAIAVDDNPPPGSQVVRPSVVGSVDTFGDATVNHHRIGTAAQLLGQFTTADPLYLALDPVVNTNVGGAFDPPVVASHLQGVAQLQLAPPTIEVTDASGSNITVKLPLMARYFPDPQTPRVAEFVRGELRITAPVDQVASPDPKNVRMVDVDIRGDKVSVNFDPQWSSQPVSAEDLAGVNLLIRNALRTSFLPSSNQLPDNVNYLKFKTLLGPPNAIAVLLNLVQLDSAGNPLPPGNPGNPATVNKVFLGSGDEFAFAASADFILGKIQFQPIANRSVPLYNLSFQLPSVEFQPDKIVLTVKGHAARRHWYTPTPSFDFTATQAFSLYLVSTTGGPLNTAELRPEGDVSVDAPWYVGWLVDLFEKGNIRQQRDDNLAQIQPLVMDALDVEKNLGGFLTSLLKPPDQKPMALLQEELKPQLAYTSVKINPSGIVLQGSLTVTILQPVATLGMSSPGSSGTVVWPPPHVEFEQIPSTSGGGRVGGGAGFRPSGTDYSALRSWIPGGTIQRYDWSMQGQAQPFHTDVNKFVLIHPPPQVSGGTPSTTAGSGSLPTEVSSGVATTGAVSGFMPICLTVRGTRIASSGSPVVQPVSATHCGYTRVSILAGLEPSLGGALPMVALTQPGPGGLVEVAGHASAQPDGAGGGAPNRLVHFADEKTAGSLEFLTQALRESGRRDAATAVVAVLTPDQLAKARYTEGVIYAEEQGSAWARAFGVKTTWRPVTLIVGHKGNIVWQHEGELEHGALVAALKTHLVPGGFVAPRLLGLSLRIGRLAPNFLFELAPGRGLTLRKLVGRPVVLVFWKSSSKPSLQAARDLQKPTGSAGGRGPVVLAINDGEAPELVQKVAAENGLSAIVVPDPQRQISAAYGVSIWPTIVFIDAFGLVRKIRYGRFAGENVESPSRARTAAAK